MLKDIFDFILMAWLFGGGFVLAILCLVWSWKIAVITFCAWLISCIITGVWFASRKL